MSNGLTVLAPDGVGEVAESSDLAALLVDALAASPHGPLLDGDVVLVTSKVVSKAEGRSRRGDRDAALAEELAAPGARVVARRGPTTIARTRHGLTMAAAGIDASNVERGTVLLLPLDPDASARALRRRLHELTGARVGVVVTDTAGRAWREGQTDIAIGAAGLLVAEDFAGRVDGHGNELAVTAPAVADELAGAAELAQGKLGGRPFAVVRGRADLVLPLDDDGPGARTLVRPEGGDLFGYGAREAVVRALVGHPADRAPFGAPAAAAEVRSAVEAVTGCACREEGREPGGVLVVSVAPGDVRLLEVLAFAHGWLVEAEETGGDTGDDTGDADVGARLRPLTP
ncbi:MAG: coenzyme F420-0:L-glutamate ligase [Actinomycetota bacterium]|nr:coenzyme F420-0:L-glutamate ligase [Actinomycetota bacterium]